MSRQHIEETKLVDYVLGNLSSQEQEEMKRHVKLCSFCEKEVAHWKQLLTNEVSIAPSPILDEKIRNIVGKKNAPEKKSQRKTWVLLASSVAVIVLLIM